MDLKNCVSKSFVILALASSGLVVGCREPGEGDLAVVGRNQNGEEILAAVSDREYSQMAEDSYGMLQSEAQEVLAKESNVDRLVVGTSAEVRAGIPFVMEAEAQSGVRIHFVRGK